MKTCPFCQLENDDTAEACQDCGIEFGTYRKSTSREDRLAYIIAGIHFTISFIFGIPKLSAQEQKQKEDIAHRVMGETMRRKTG
jgi:hypothetical protein